jgi:outer membrane protein assembly factor BamD (BamD/ComL family)
VKEAVLKKTLISALLISALWGCSSHKVEVVISPEIKNLQEMMIKGSYDDALKAARELSAKVPASPDAAQALYLEGYILAYNKADIQNARPPLRKLLEAYPQSSYAVSAQKLIADSQYWQGHYRGAVEEYKKLAAMGDVNLALYSKLQTGNCLLMDDKVDAALNHYHELIEKNPGTAIADSAQLMTANAYLKLQNVSQAKKELKKLIAQSQNHDIQESAQKALRQIEEEASFDKEQHDSK